MYLTGQAKKRKIIESGREKNRDDLLNSYQVVYCFLNSDVQ